MDESSQNKPWVGAEAAPGYQIIFFGPAYFFWTQAMSRRVGIPVPKPPICGLANGLPNCPKWLLWQSALILQSGPLLISIAIWPKSTAWLGDANEEKGRERRGGGGKEQKRCCTATQSLCGYSVWRDWASKTHPQNASLAWNTHSEAPEFNGIQWMSYTQCIYVIFSVSNILILLLIPIL